MNFIIIGCGRVGAQLAFNLYQLGHKITVIDNNGASFNNLPAKFLGRTIEGEATHLDVLKRAGIEHADGLAVVTNSDSLNAVIGQVAKKYFDRRNVVVRNYDPLWRSMVSAFNLDIVSSSSWGAQRIEGKLINPDFMMTASIGNGEISIYELSISEELNNLTLSSLFLDQNCGVVGLVREGNTLMPDMDMKLKKGDLLLISASRTGASNLQKRFISFKEKQA